MNPLRLEAKRFLYSLWMFPAVLLVLAGLTFYAYRTGVLYRAEESRMLLALVLSTVKYHVLLYGVLAIALAGVDAANRIPLLETLAGGSSYRFLGRKLILYAGAVLVCELVYLLVPLLLWRVPLWELMGLYRSEGLTPPILRLLPARLFLDLGIAFPLFLLQAALPSLQSMLVADSAAAILWIGLFNDHLEQWFKGILLQPLPRTWFLWAALSILASILLSFAAFRLKAMRR